MVAFLLLLYIGSAPEDRLRAAAVILVFFICPRLFLFDPCPVSLPAPGFITVFSVPVFLPHCTLDSSPRAWFRPRPARDRKAGAAPGTPAAATGMCRRDGTLYRCRATGLHRQAHSHLSIAPSASSGNDSERLLLFFLFLLCQALAPADLRPRRKKTAAPMITAATTMMR